MEKSGIDYVNNVLYFVPKVLFGKIKTKRFGRELSRYDIFEFVNIKSVILCDQLIQHYFVE